MLNNKFFILMMITVIIETIGLSFIKKYHLCKKNGEKYNAIKYFLLGVMLYAIVCYMLDKCFYYAPLWMTNVVWNGFSIILVILAGTLIFNEQFYIHDLVATILVLLAIIIFEYTNKNQDNL